MNIISVSIIASIIIAYLIFRLYILNQVNKFLIDELGKEKEKNLTK